MKFLKIFILGMVLTLFIQVNTLNAQCPSFPFVSGTCGNINPGLQILGGDLFCYQGCVDFEITTAIQVDSVCINFGDNNYLTIYPTILDTVVTHCYNISPQDSCPNPSPLAIFPEAKYYKSCAAGFSYKVFSTQGSVRFLPRPQFSLTKDTVCVNEVVGISLINPPNACTNGFLNYPADYTWYLDGTAIGNITNTTINSFTAPNAFSISTPGTHVIKLECTNSCGTNMVQHSIVVGPIPTPQIIPTNLSFCPGNQAILYAGPGYVNYLWSTGSINDSITVGVSGNFTVTVTNIYGCTASTDTAVTLLPSPPPPQISGSVTYCAGGSTVLYAPVGFGPYLWTGGSTADSLVVNSAGVYAVTITGPNGCTATSSVNVTQSAVLAINISATPQTICNGSLITLDAGSGGGWTYLWSNGSTTQTIQTNVPGTYTVTVTSGLCTGTDSQIVVLGILPAPVITGNDTICQGQSTLFGVGAFTTYLWNTGATTQTIVPVNAGNYTVTVTNGSGCSGSASYTLTIHPLPNPSISGTQQVCQGGSSVFNGGAGYISYLWSNGSTTQTISVNTTGTYTLTVTNNYSCAASVSQLFTVNPNPTPAISGTTSICSGNNANLDAGTYSSYLWNTGATIQTISVSNQGNYTVTVTDSHGCTGTTSVNVSVSNNPVANITTGQSTICQGSSTILDAGVGYAYLWNNGATTQTISTTIAGTYTVTITDGNGCSGSDSQLITVNPSPNPMINGPTTVCSADVYALTVALPLYTTYLWSNGSTALSIIPISSGNYTVTVTNAYNCSGTATVPFTYHVNPVISITGNDTICQGFNSTLNAGGGMSSYLWSNGLTSQTITVNSPNTFTVTVTDNYGCTATDDLLFVVNPLPNPVITGDSVVCQGTIVTMDAGSGYAGYQWQNGSTTQTFSTTLSGLYTVTVTDSNGCKNHDQFALTVNPIPIPTITGNSAFCTGSSTLLNCGNGFNSYLWSTGDITQNIYASVIGIYSVVVTDVNGCTGSDSIYVSENPLPSVNISGDPAICSGGTSVLNAGPGFNSYLWSNGVTTQVNTVGIAGTYIVTITDNNNCSSQDQFTLTVFPTPTPQIMGDFSVCDGNISTLTCDAGYQSYQWTTGAVTQSINVNVTGVYSVTVTDIHGCTASVNHQFTVNPLPNPSFQSGTVKCYGDTVVLTPGPGYVSYLWSNAATTSSVIAYNSGTYQVTVTDGNGCTAITGTTLTFYPLPTPVITGDPVICNGETSNLDAGNGYVSYLWSDGTLNQYNNATSGGSYTVTVVDTNLCKGTSAPFNLTVLNGVANITYNSPLDFCQGNDIILTADSALSYLWSDGSTSQSITVNQTGQYLVTVIDLNGCPAISSIIQTYMHLAPIVDFEYDSLLNCPGWKFKFTNLSDFEPGSLLIWDFGDGYFSNEDSPNHVYSTPGQFYVILYITSPVGCQSSDTIGIITTFNPLAEAAFEILPNVNGIYSKEFSFIDHSVDAVSWSYDFGDGNTSVDQNPLHRYDEVGQYVVTQTVKNIDGCESVFQKDLIVAPFYIPNAFTPNGDGINEQFYVSGYSDGPYALDVNDYKMTIINRWGQVIFTSHSAGKPWDGVDINGKKCPEGVYTYIIEIKPKAGKPKTFIGKVSLIR